jgi:hypothetical protein
LAPAPVTTPPFLWLRGQRVPRVSVREVVRDDQPVDTSVTEVHTVEVAGDYGRAVGREPARVRLPAPVLAPAPR